MSAEYDAAVEVREAVDSLERDLNQNMIKLLQVLWNIAESLEGISKRLSYATVLDSSD